MTNETDSNRPLCFQYRDEQIEKAMENFKGAAKHHGETDIYGMSAEERAAFEAWAFPENLDPEFADDVFLAPTTNIAAIAWAACAKLYRAQLASARERLRQADMLHLETLDRENELFYKRIKELEAEVERLRAELALVTQQRDRAEARIAGVRP